jgi:hypothetical protein
MVGPVYDRHLDVGTGQGVRDIDAAEPATYDDYPVPLTVMRNLLGRALP